MGTYCRSQMSETLKKYLLRNMQDPFSSKLEPLCLSTGWGT